MFYKALIYVCWSNYSYLEANFFIVIDELNIVL